MYSPPDPATTARMRAHHDHAAAALDIALGGGEFWGWAGRTLGRAGALTGGRRVWLRLTTAPEAKASGKLWEGNATAEMAFGALGGHRPRLLALHDTNADGTVYRAELSEHIDAPVISPDPIPRTTVDPLPGWWTDLRGALDTVAGVATTRIAVREEYLHRALPQFLGVRAPDTITWTTAHGDLHWANLTAPALRILDWEGWGRAPYGYDQATLYAYSLHQPDLATRVRTAFPELGTPTAWAGEATIAAELLQTVARGDNAELAEHLHAWVEQLHACARASA
ncbi:hypothetical protein [Streptomyces sp. NPDC037389]|uniref:hypothetical protein n=1 Tax=Streptomyces sp. NPDC037389 TaxID=3155369 RepID=UPI0033CD7D97